MLRTSDFIPCAEVKVDAELTYYLNAFRALHATDRELCGKKFRVKEVLSQAILIKIKVSDL